MKISKIETWAKGNGVPCHGDHIETEYQGHTVSGEVYAEKNNGGFFSVSLAADSQLLVDGKPLPVTNDEEADDARFNELVDALCNSVEIDLP
jgi:hypothetical protein